jgi:hypothetical protein
MKTLDLGGTPARQQRRSGQLAHAFGALKLREREVEFGSGGAGRRQSRTGSQSASIVFHPLPFLKILELPLHA